MTAGIYRLVLILLMVAAGLGVYHYPALHMAAHADKPKIVKRLLWMGYDIEARENYFLDSVTMTPIEWEAHSGAAQSTLVLFNAGANPIVGRGALHVAAQQFHPNVVRTLLELGVDPNLPSATGGSTALHWLIGSASPVCGNKTTQTIKFTHMMEIARMLLAHGADPNSRAPLTPLQIEMNIPNSGRTPLYDAIMRGCVDVVQLLMKYGADKHAVVYGKSVLEAFNSGKIPAHWPSISADVRAELANILAQ